jgi:hypothetical protein
VCHIFIRLDNIENKQILFKNDVDNKFDKIFLALQKESPKKGIFYENQVFDAQNKNNQLQHLVE